MSPRAPASNVHVVPAEADGRRLFDHLADALGGVQQRRLGAVVTSGALLVEGRSGRIAQRLVAGQRLWLEQEAEADLRARMVPVADLDLVVRFHDEHLLVVDKPKGMQVHPMGRHRDRTLMGGLLWLAGARPDHLWTTWRPHLVNRLDRPTSGLVAVALSRAVRTTLQDALAEGAMRRTYRAVVHGDVPGDEGTVDLALGRDPAFDYRRAPVAVEDGGQRAVTHWAVVERLGDRTVVDLELETGRTHQIRAHLAAMGHPIVGDVLYAEGTAPEADDRIALHARALQFPHPVTGVEVACESAAAWPD